jgi:hypothetical protein
MCGCQSVPFFSKFHYLEADSRHPLMEVLCVWEPAEGRGVDNAPARGFGGQILCFASGYKEPVKVRGDVRIYVFDDKGVNGDSSLPIHQFDFTADAWNTFLKPSSLGASYQIFIPYTRKGLDAANCTLRVRLTPEGGLPVYSRMATVALAGQGVEKKKPASETVQTVSHEETSHKGQGITTADFSEITLAGKAPNGGLPPSKTPGISMSPPRDEARQTEHLLNSLRRASEEASRKARTEPPEKLPDVSSLALKSLARETTSSDEVEAIAPADQMASDRGDNTSSTGKSSPKRRHPLEDLDME